MKAPPAKTSGKAPKIVEGSDISGTYKWDGKPYTDEKTGQVIDTEIEDVLHKQGFDGVPKVVGQEEFDRIISEHPEMPILMRSYSAPNPDTLGEYDSQLESGAWYVDCGVGGAQYGQGMYTVGVYSGEDRKKVTKGALAEMQHYRALNEDRIRLSTRAEHEATYERWQDPPKYIKPIDSDMVYERTGNKEPLDISKINDGDVFCITHESKFPGDDKVYLRDMLVTKKDGKIVKLSDPDTEINEQKARLLTEHRNAVMQKMSEHKYSKPVSSTRIMTVDPSAKIITYSELQSMRMGTVREAEKAKIKSEEFDKFIGDKENAMPDEMLAIFRHRQGMDRGKSDADAYYQASREFDTWDKTSRDAFAHRLLDLEADFRGKFRDRMDKAEELAEQKASKLREYHDYGVMAAALGYDAINAGGHGATGSYTVVLNRTKVILSDQRVKVER